MSKVTIQFEGGPGVEFESEVLSGPWVDMWHGELKKGGDQRDMGDWGGVVRMNAAHDRTLVYMNGRMDKKGLDAFIGALLAARILMEGK